MRKVRTKSIERGILIQATLGGRRLGDGLGSETLSSYIVDNIKYEAIKYLLDLLYFVFKV